MERTERVSREHDSAVLRELRKLRQEHAEAAGDNKRALAGLEMSMRELMDKRRKDWGTQKTWVEPLLIRGEMLGFGIKNETELHPCTWLSRRSGRE